MNIVVPRGALPILLFDLFHLATFKHPSILPCEITGYVQDTGLREDGKLPKHVLSPIRQVERIAEDKVSFPI